MAETRIYVVTGNGAQTGSKRLVDAVSAAQAIRHCAKEIYTAQAASPKEIAALMSNGTQIEQANEATTNTPT